MMSKILRTTKSLHTLHATRQLRWMGSSAKNEIIYGDEAVIMSEKSNGTCSCTPASQLRWNIDPDIANGVCCHNRHFAEPSGYFTWIGQHRFMQEIDKSGREVTFYDSITQKPLFVAPRGRSYEEFEEESRDHGWPSFRIDEVVWENVRVVGSRNEAVSVDGTHLGHNIPDHKGPRFCINLVSIAGMPPESE